MFFINGIQPIKSMCRLFTLSKRFYSLYLFTSILSSPLSAESIPHTLQSCPRSDQTGIVLGVKRIQIRGLTYFYNASLIDHGDSYRLFFRVDTPHVPPFVSHIGCVELDRDFNQTDKEYEVIDTGSSHSEDPRALWVGEHLWLIFNDEGSRPGSHRSMYAATLNNESLEVQNILELDLGLKPVEKNWPPFEGVLEEGAQPQLCFEYLIAPHVILNIPNPLEASINFLQPFPDDHKYELLWPKVWGQMRGGTPAKKISEDEYLSFFHSSFSDGKGTRWYIIGAYTFDAKAPYTVNRISSTPIIFKGMYDTPTYRKDLKVLFPAGFVIENRDGREVIQLSCGENDMGIKILTLDKEALLKSLEPAVHRGRKRFHRWR